MPTLIDYTNKKIDKLLVLEKTESRKRHVYWKCLCDCGNICERSSEYLKRTNLPRDCGCSKKSTQKKIRKIEKETRLVGQRFERLTVIKRTDRKTKNNRSYYWLCRCDCGNFKEVPGEYLMNGHTKSCGCLKLETHLIDITGQRFNKLVAIKQDPNNGNNWIFKCDCGNIKSINSCNVRMGHTQSCGCITTSIGETNIQNILIENNLSFKKEYHPIDGYGRYDFSILDESNNIIRLIEFDGEQHFLANRGTWRGADSLKQIKERDQIKNKYALSHNIPLVRIPYWERDKITLEMIMGDQYLVKEE